MQISKIVMTGTIVFGMTAAAAPVPSYIAAPPISGPDGGWDYASVDPVKDRLYLAHGDAIVAVDLATKAVNPRLAAAERAHAVLVLDGGKTLLTTNGTSGMARFLDTTSGAPLAELSTGTKPDAAVYDAATKLVAVMNAGDGSIALLDTATRTLVGKVVVGGALEAAAGDGKGRIWVNVEDKNEIVEVDLWGRRVVSRTTLTGCDGPTGAALVAAGTRVISACANGVATVVDPVARKVVATLRIGAGPDGVLFDAARGVALIPCGGSGTLEIIAAARPEAIHALGSVATKVSAKTAALDPRDGTVYLPSATLLPPEPGAKRGKPAPGSFAILVLKPQGTR